MKSLLFSAGIFFAIDASAGISSLSNVSGDPALGKCVSALSHIESNTKVAKTGIDYNRMADKFGSPFTADSAYIFQRAETADGKSPNKEYCSLGTSGGICWTVDRMSALPQGSQGKECLVVTPPGISIEYLRNSQTGERYTYHYQSCSNGVKKTVVPSRPVSAAEVKTMLKNEALTRIKQMDVHAADLREIPEKNPYPPLPGYSEEESQKSWAENRKEALDARKLSNCEDFSKESDEIRSSYCEKMANGYGGCGAAAPSGTPQTSDSNK